MSVRTRTKHLYIFQIDTHTRTRVRVPVTRYEVRFTRNMPDGKPINFQRCFDSLRLAQRERDAALATIADGTYQSRKSIAANAQSDIPSKITVAEALEKYIAFLIATETVPPSKRAQNRIRFIGKQAVGKVKITELQDHHVDEYIAARLGKGVARTTVRKEVAILKRWRNLAHIPALGVYLPAGNLSHQTKLPQSDARTRRPTSDEFDLMLAELEERDPAVAWAAKLAAETAMRQSELCNAKWSDIDYKTGLLNLSSLGTKTRTQRGVPLSTAALKILEAIPRKLGSDRTHILGGLTSERCCRIWRDVRTHLGIMDLRFHDLRAEAITRKAGMLSLPELQVLSGHKSLTMLTRYLRVDAVNVAAKLQAE